MAIKHQSQKKELGKNREIKFNEKHQRKLNRFETMNGNGKIVLIL